MRYRIRFIGLSSRLGTAILAGVLLLPMTGVTAAGHAAGDPIMQRALPAAHLNAPFLRRPQGGSVSYASNWSGYAAGDKIYRGKPNSATDVQGQWNVPAVICGSTNAFNSIWVGIDGFSLSDPTVEQLGTAQKCVGGQASYSAWYEMFPSLPVAISMTINPGDVVAAEVQFTGNNTYVLSLKDSTTGTTFSTTQTGGAKNEGVEWISEAPGWRPLPLANFGTVTFTNCQATIDGQVVAIDGASQWAEIIMANKKGLVKAQTSALTSTGTGFTVTWKHS